MKLELFSRSFELADGEWVITLFINPTNLVSLCYGKVKIFLNTILFRRNFEIKAIKNEWLKQTIGTALLERELS